MKNNQVVSYALIGLALAGLGFANFLAQRGKLIDNLNRDQVAITEAADSPLELADLEKLQASESAESSESAVVDPIVIEPQYVRLEATQSGQTAFSLLLESVPGVKYKKFDFGFFIESINDLPGDNNNFWAFYLNGEKSETGADSVVLKKGEVVEFKYEKVEF